MQYPKTCKEIKHTNKILIWDKMLSHTRMGVPYEYTHMGRPICVWDNIRIWGRTDPPVITLGCLLKTVADQRGGLWGL